jgi:hypothetical protein
MTILDGVLAELRGAKGPIRSSDLALRMGISEGTLDGMVSVLVAKGKLVGSEPAPVEDVVACSGVACGTSCVGLEKCPFIAGVPDTFTLVIESPRVS